MQNTMTLTLFMDKKYFLALRDDYLIYITNKKVDEKFLKKVHFLVTGNREILMANDRALNTDYKNITLNPIGLIL